MKRQYFEFPVNQQESSTIFLKHADKLVREGKYQAALDAITKAREENPKNQYALAYKERVLALLKEKKQQKSGRKAANRTYPDTPILPPIDEQIAKIATVVRKPGEEKGEMNREPGGKETPKHLIASDTQKFKQGGEERVGVNENADRVAQQQKLLHSIMRSRKLFESGQLPRL